MCLVNLEDVIYGLVSEFKTVLPQSNHYVGKLSEKPQRPCFLYLLVFNSDKQSSYFTKDTVIDLQIIYFGVNDRYGSQSFEDKMATMQSLKGFLSGFKLKVEDRSLPFEYSFGEADQKLTVDIKFKFMDGVVNLKCDEEQLREKIGNIYINNKELI